MASCIPQLIEALDRKRNELKELLHLTEEEQRCIIEIDMAGLEILENNKRDLLMSMENTNTNCKQLLKEAAEECRLEGADSLSPIIHRVPSPLREKLSELQSGLLDLGQSLNKALEFNAELLANSIRHVEDSLGFLSSFLTTSTTYGESGSMVRTSDEVRLVRKEA
jgi:flagellar biosynthesis/type III secretory pathway chaperone